MTTSPTSPSRSRTSARYWQEVDGGGTMAVHSAVMPRARHRHLTVRLSEAEQARYHELARAVDRPLSQLVRLLLEAEARAVLDLELPPAPTHADPYDDSCCSGCEQCDPQEQEAAPDEEAATEDISDAS